ncbi:MAG: hypothetical protein RIB60_00980 [Phycisphaerales bacterium]
MRKPGVIEVTAHAKVNLALAVGPPIEAGDRAGLHPICSWMHAIELGDAVRVERLAGDAPTTLDVRWADGSGVDWAMKDDLAARAHRALEAHAGRALPVSIRVLKRVPAGGGLGGGSADAAAVLLACDELFELNLSDDTLRRVSAAIGSDVAFFIDGDAFAQRRPPRPAVVSGLGDRIERIDRHGDEIALILPTFGCPTGAVYQAFDENPTAGVDEARVRALAAGDSIGWDQLFNDLARAACVVRPELSNVLDVPGVRLSGSGSTAFAPAHALHAVRRALPGIRIETTRLA